jgi:SAM-dependent methyltransferase
MVEKSAWMQQVEQNPDHSHWYVQRFRALAEAGEDLHGEARMIDAMVPRGSRILDAGCGTGRTGGRLAELGHEVVGVDVDPVLIQAASEDYPDVPWYVQDLAELNLDQVGEGEPFEVIVSTGNVMAFLAASTRRAVLSNLAGVLTPTGRLVVGFGAGRGYLFTDFLEDAEASGLQPDVLLSTWDLRPWTPESDFLVAVLSRSDS